jgi:hypothetical protein
MPWLKAILENSSISRLMMPKVTIHSYGISELAKNTMPSVRRFPQRE